MISDIHQSVELLMTPGDVHELRVPKAGRYGTISGYYDNPTKLASDAAKLDGDFSGIYITLNPCNPALLARAANRFQERAAVTTADTDIVRRRWLLIDCDPVRPSGISSTEHEHGRAIATACGIWDDLRGAGFPDPVVCDSGNGAHLLFRVDAPNTPAVTDAIRRMLAALGRYCAPDDVSVDASVFNPARITKLYGTMTCKGDSTPDPPHRRSRILEIPARLQVTEVEAAA
jgi:hypothetical protein